MLTEVVCKCIKLIFHPLTNYNPTYFVIKQVGAIENIIRMLLDCQKE